jgi:hypothetical protein
MNDVISQAFCNELDKLAGPLGRVMNAKGKSQADRDQVASTLRGVRNVIGKKEGRQARDTMLKGLKTQTKKRRVGSGMGAGYLTLRDVMGTPKKGKK